MLTSLGGAGTVTGSKHLVEVDGRRLLIDCGLFQGPRELRELNWKSLPVRASSIDAVILTHAHLDHCGYLPRLVNDGFAGPVYATRASIDVARMVLLDSAYLQERDADYANRHGFSRHQPALPLYTKADALRAIDLMHGIGFDQTLELGPGASLLFRRAGHILGAATVTLRVAGQTIVFSGDLGRFGDATMVDPAFVPAADFLVVESTYGGRVHPLGEAEIALRDIIHRTVRRGGTLVIPAFAIGRTQSLLFQLWTLKMQGELDLVPIYVDSPMAIDATELMATHMDDHRLQPIVCHEAFSMATYVRDTEGSKRLTANPMPKVIISASGMASGGRVLHHLKAFGGDPRSTILLAGFQAAGTRGRALADGARELKIHGQYRKIRAEVVNLTMLSAHADSEELMRWLRGFETAPKTTFIVHGEPDASRAFADRIAGELGWPCIIPQMGQRFELQDQVRHLRSIDAVPAGESDYSSGPGSRPA